MSTAPLMTSPFQFISWTHSNKAWSTSGLVTTHGLLDDRALGIDSMRASISVRCCSLHDRVAWLKSNAPWALVAKYLTTSPCLIGWGRLSMYEYTVIQLWRVRFSCLASLISCADVFGVSLEGPRGCSRPCWATSVCHFWRLHFHSSRGMVMEIKRVHRMTPRQFRCPKKKNSYVVLT